MNNTPYPQQPQPQQPSYPPQQATVPPPAYPQPNPLYQQPKKNTTKIIVAIVIAVVSVAVIAIAALILTQYSIQKKAEETVAAICQNNDEVLMTAYMYEEDDISEYYAYYFSFEDENNVEAYGYDLVYRDGEPVYQEFEELQSDSFYFKIDGKGNIMLTSVSEYWGDFYVETDENNAVTNLYSDFSVSFSVAEEHFATDITYYQEHKAQLENIDNVAPAFLQWHYYGYSPTWQKVLDNTFKYYDISVVPDDTYENGYLLTIAGEYSINPVDLPDVTREGSIVIATNNEVTEGTLVSGDDALQACDLYVSLGTTWYLDQFYGNSY